MDNLDLNEKDLDLDEQLIICNCDESCGISGLEGEIAGHVKGCPCGKCHRHYSKLR